MKDKEIIQALRCTSTPGGLYEDCTGCPYYREEQLDAERKEKLGVDTWPSCDVNKVGMDAADIIERLTAENTALREGASLGKAKRPQKIAYEKSIEFLRALTDGQSDEIKSFRRELEWKDMVIALTKREQEKAEAERDAAIADLKISSGCTSCKYHCSDTIFCRDCNKKQNCKCMSCSLGLPNWEWHGLPEEPEEGGKA